MRRRLAVLMLAVLGVLLLQGDSRADWTTPRTWVSGETVTSAMMNEQVRDNLNVLATAPRVVAVNVTPAGTLSGGDVTQTLMLYTIPAATLTTSGQGFRFTFWGSCKTGLGAGAARAEVYLGSMGTAAVSCPASTGGQWQYTAVAMRIGATSGTWFVNEGMYGTTGSTATATDTGSWAPTWANSLVVSIKGIGAALGNDDVVARGMMVERIQ